jgi:hypothetical protein
MADDCMSCSNVLPTERDLSTTSADHRHPREMLDLSLAGDRCRRFSKGVLRKEGGITPDYAQLASSRQLL